MERDEVRRKVIGLRDQLTPEDLVLKSESVIRNLFQLAEFLDASTVMFYASFKSEVQTMGAIASCLKTGKRVALPLTLAKEKILQPYLIKDPGLDLRSGYCDIPEPDPESSVLLDSGEIDLVVIPGSVFDGNGGRWGYGGGFYDRFLVDRTPTAFRVALAFELQVCDNQLALESHDQLMHCLVTEAKTLRFTAAGSHV